MPKVLEGIKVLDFTRYIAGPYCGMLLAVMGADVIRVEPPGGEIDRDIGPYAPTGEGMYPWQYCCNKRGITLNLRTEKGRDILKELVKKSDVLLEAFIPRSKRRMGLDYDSLEKINPRLILVSISGFGQYGPYSDYGCFDAVAQAMAGLMVISGFPGSPPSRPATSFVDYATGVYAALGTMIALYHREKTGVGQAVDACLMDTALSFTETIFAEYKILGEERQQIGNRRPFVAPCDMYKTKDGYVQFSIALDSFWHSFVKLIGREDLRDDPRFKSNYVRYKNQEILNQLASEWVANKTVDEVVKLLREAGIVCGPVYSIPQVMADPHVQAREMIVNLDYPGVKDFPVPGIALKFSETPGKITKRAPMLGEHNEEVYSELLGLSQNEVTKLRQEGVI